MSDSDMRRVALLAIYAAFGLSVDEDALLFQAKSYTVATLPTASTYPRGIIYVSNEAGGATLAFSDGTNWRRCHDRVIVS